MGENRVTRRIVISGYYGFRNSGDEAVLQSILLALAEQGEREGIRIVPVVLSADPDWTSRTYGVDSVPRMKLGALIRAIRNSDGLISGGGSLLQDATGLFSIPYYLGILQIAQWFKKPTFIYSQGVGPVNRKPFYGLIRSVFGRSRYVSVRDQESADLLRRIGVRQPIDVVPDPVMGMPLRDGAAPAARSGDAEAAHGGVAPVLGIAIRFWNADRSELDALAHSLLRIVERTGAELRFLPFHLPSDETASQHVIERMAQLAPDRPLPQLRVVVDADHPQQMLAEVAACDALIGMRLHSLIYAASRRVPMAGISYDPKIDQFLRRLGMEAAASVSEFHADRLADETVELLRSRTDWMNRKEPLIVQLIQEAQRPARQIAQLLK